MTLTPKLSLPYIMPAQAQKHVTHNEALAKLDVIVQLSVLSMNLMSPPEVRSNGDTFIVASNGQNEWLNKDAQIALWDDETWTFFTPLHGWLCWNQDNKAIYVFNNETWMVASNSTDNLTQVGVNADSDETNRLTVKSDAVLLSHDDVSPGNGDMRLVLNKASDENIAGIVFQNQYEGRAEITLGSEEDLSFRVSEDGSNWYDAMRIDSQNKNIVLPDEFAQFGININEPDHSFHVNKSQPSRLTAAFAMTGWARSGPSPADGDEGGVGLYLNYNQPGNRQFALCDTTTGNGVRFFGTGFDAITNFGNRADVTIGTYTNGAHVGLSIGGTQFSVSNQFGTSTKTVFEVAGKTDQEGDLFRVTKAHGTQNGDALTIKANGHSILGAPLALALVSVASLPDEVATGAITFCTDATDGAQPIYYDGINWRKMRDGDIVSNAS